VTEPIAASVDSHAPTPGYYGVPVIHGPHWDWHIVAYFYLGGISGAAAVIGAAARLAGGPDNEPISRAATYVSFAALIPCPALLILDLGRPARFLNMLRVLNTSSPMSIGTWGLTAFGIVSTGITAWQSARDLAIQPVAGVDPSRRAVRAAFFTLDLLGGILGIFVAGYTAVLLVATAVPLWSKRPTFLGPLFLSSAMASAAAAILVVIEVLTSEETVSAERLSRLERLAALAEGVTLVSWIAALGPTARPIVTGHIGGIVQHGVGGIGIALPLVVSAIGTKLPPRARRATALAASAFTLLGGTALRYAVVEGGRRSAADPQATFEITG
jgi:formate-dependent nitrite reductase membrane component NrfD